MEKISCSTADLAAENAKKLIGLFPECEGERGTVDLDKLRQVLSSTVVEGNVERYEFTWPGKRMAVAAASAATTKTLRPCAEESVGKDGTKGGFDSENLYIEGDNLEALKLLQCNYAGKVKMIYIDPPYNTGHDFVYRDRFSLTDKEAALRGDQLNDDGKWNVDHPEINEASQARYHSNWCSMMYPRLKLARNLLRDDGVIFISLDDNEAINIRKLCDEIFGDANFIAQITVVSNPRGRDYGGIAKMHEYVFAYRKSDELTLSLVKDESCEFPFEDGKGGFELRELRNRNVKFNKENRPNLYYPFYINPSKTDENGFYEIDLENHDGWIKLYPKPSQGVDVVWRWGQQKAVSNLNGEIVAKKMLDGGFMIVEKYRESRKMARSVWWDKESNTERGTIEVKKLFEDRKFFDYPKPVSMLERMLEMATAEFTDAIILDFFSGSATTAHAVMKLNAEDGGNRKFIMVQLPEVCDEWSEAAKAGYKNICEIGKERIRRAGKKIREELAAKNAEKTKDSAPDLFRQDLQDSQDLSKSNLELDVGFRVLKLDSSSLNDTSATVGETVQEFENFNRIKSDRTSEDLLFQILLETRIPLSESIAKVKVGANEVFLVGVGELGSEGIGELASVGGVPLVACLDQKAKLDNEFFIELAKLKPEIVFFRDDAFTTDSARINVEQIFRQNSPSSAVKVI